MARHRFPVLIIAVLRRSLLRFVRSLNFGGVMIALIFFWASLAPSLLPRPWYLQVVVSAIVGIIGYGLGSLAALVVRMVVRRPNSGRYISLQWRSLFGILGAVIILYQLVASAVWQHEMWLVVGKQPPDTMWLTSTLGVLIPSIVFICIAIIILRSIGLLLARLFVWLRQEWFLKIIPKGYERSAVSVLILVIMVLIANGVILRGVNALVTADYKASNSLSPKVTGQPLSNFDSGGPGSYASWNSLGYYGQKFIIDPPTTSQISAVTGQPAMEPIRVYVGYKQGADLHNSAVTAVSELQRTGAFHRKAILIVVTTGMGWVDEKSIRPLEYILNGDVATVAIQYSYLPSWISFLKDRQQSIDAAYQTISAIEAADAGLAPGQRPDLYLFGESLGSFGAESAMYAHKELDDTLAGIVLIGPPGFNSLHNQLTEDRLPGTPSYKPIVGNGKDAIFITAPQQFEAVSARPRLIYLQNPTDPVTKWNARILWAKPAWIREQKRDGLLPRHFVWMPVVTFLQVTVDMILSNTMPPGYGHVYGTEATGAWEKLTGINLTPDQQHAIDLTLKEN